MKTIIFENLPSTNDYAKKHKFKEDVLIVAKTQSQGRGTKGRSFLSDDGGIYLSLVRIKPCKARECFKLMINSAMAVVRTLKAFGVDGKIKWPNDVLVNGKKICGILIENVFSGDDVEKSVIGIGLNANNELSDEIKDIATSMKEVLSEEVEVKDVLATLAYHRKGPS